MFRSARMNRVRVLAFEEYLADIEILIGRLGILHLLDIKKNVKPALNPGMDENLSNKISDILRRVYHVIEILDIVEPENRIEIALKKRSPQEYLDYAEEKLTDIEGSVLKKSKELAELQEEKKRLSNEPSVLRYMGKFGIKQEFFGISKFLYVTGGFIPYTDLSKLEISIKEIVGDNYLFIHEQENERIQICIMTLSEYTEDIERILAHFKFEKFIVKERDLIDVQKKLHDVNTRIQKIEYELNSVRRERLNDILVIKEIGEIEKKNLYIMLMLGRTESVCAIEAWVPEKHVNMLTEGIEKVTEGNSIIRVYKPKENENVPTELENPKIVKPFEILTEMFGLPSYSEIDPTPILAITFPLIFGLMFGDIGHGAIFALTGIAILRLMKNNFGNVLLYCGISAMIFGFLYGSIFGYEEILPTIWKKPSNEITDMIGIALFIGIMHMSIGLMLGGINKIYEYKLLSALTSIAKVWLLFGEAIIIAKLFRFPITLFFELSKLDFITILVYGMGIPVITILLIEIIHELKHRFSIRELFGVIAMGLFDVLETFTGFLSNTISYSRILILAVVHAMMCAAIFTIAEIFGYPLGIIILIGGTVLVIVLEGLIAFIHTIRLHYYEWFTKFYSGDGTKYEPFRIERRYTSIP